jgi:hypothetical protein
MGRVWSSASQFGALGGEYVNLGTGAGGILLMQAVAFESRKRHANGDRSGGVQGHLRRQCLIDGMDCSGHPMGHHVDVGSL